jgi:ABC-type Mn2+/Zn2+ transport system ATPase subunit
MAVISLKNILVKYALEPVLVLPELVLETGEVLVVVGPNGSGKSTLLKIILGLINFSGDLDRNFNRVGYLPQHDELNLDFPITVENLVAMGLPKEIANPKSKILEPLLVEFQLLALRNKLLNELSGGQLQRALIARAFAQDAEVLLLDEPNNELDKQAQNLLVEKIRVFAKAKKLVIVTTHDLELANKISSRVLLLKNKIVALGPASAVLTTANLQAAFSDTTLHFDDGECVTVTEHLH